MIMKVDLFFCGDSNTFGEELQGLEEDNKKRIEQRYSTLVSKELGKTHYNVSQSGACNDWIVKTVLEWFEKGNTCDTAIIQFSDAIRWGFYDKDGKYENLGASKIIPKFVSSETTEAHSVYNEKIWSEQLELDNYWKNMFFLRNYLKDKCKVVWMTLSRIPKRETNMWSKLCKDIEIGEQKYIIGDNKCPKIPGVLPGTHPNEIGHQNIAKWILKNL